MARTKTTQTVKTVTTRRSGVDQQEVLREVAGDIRNVRTEVARELDALEKVRGMLDVGYLRELLRKIEALEIRLSEMEAGGLDSMASLALVQEELEREQDRLAKLWDAYKIQEDELQRLKRDYPLMEEKLFERERTIDNLRREIAHLQPLAQYKSEYQALLVENQRLKNEVEEGRAAKAEAQRLRGEVNRLEGELDRNKRSIRELEDQVSSLRAIEHDTGREAELEALLAEEQERLTKLYAVYQQLEEEKKALEDRLAKWERWFSMIAPTLEDVGKAPTTAPHTTG